MEVISHDHIALKNLNQLLSEIRTSFVTAERRLSYFNELAKPSDTLISKNIVKFLDATLLEQKNMRNSLACMESIRINKNSNVDKNKDVLKRRNTLDNRKVVGNYCTNTVNRNSNVVSTGNKVPNRNTITTNRKISTKLKQTETKPRKDVLPPSEDTDVHIIDKLNNLMEVLESSFQTFTPSTDRVSVIGKSGPEFVNGGIQDERYVLDDFSRFMSKKYPSKTMPPRRRRSDSDLERSHNSDYMLHTIDQHSTLCRRLKTVEASFGITLKKQLHFFMKKKMKIMNVSGCVYCTYAFYEKQKREADDKAKLIRKTRAEQESLRRKLSEQKEQSDADSQWLMSEEVASYAEVQPSADDQNFQRHSWKDGLHPSGSKSDSEQLGYDLFKEDFARDIIEKKAKRNSTLRRSIPLWGFERNDFANEKKPSPLAREVPPPTTPPGNESAIEPPSPPVITTDNVRDEDIQPIADVVDSAKPKLSRSNSASDTYAKPIKKKDRLEETIPRCNTTGQIENKNSSPRLRTRSEQKPLKKEKQENKPTADVVYQHTTSVVKSVIELNTGVQHAQPEEFVDLVKVVGLNLRDLLAEVDKEIQLVPSISQKEIEMAHKVLSSDMAELVNTMKLAQKYADTTLDQQYRRNMLAAAHALAIDAKNLYDTFSKLKNKVLEETEEEVEEEEEEEEEEQKKEVESLVEEALPN